MKKSLAILLCAAATFGVASAANASGGCGPAFHRNVYGACRPNYGPGRGPVVVGPGYVVGVFYPGRGYWDGRRFWGHRDPWRGGWRYR